MRIYFFLATLALLSACNYSAYSASSSRMSTITPDHDLTVSAISYVQATSMPTQTPQPHQVPTAMGRAFENGLPLAARVNNQPLFLTTYERQLVHFEQVLNQQDLDLDSQVGQSDLSQIHQQVLESLLVQLIIEQQAERLGLGVTSEEVEIVAQEAIAQVEDYKQFEMWLAANNLTYQEFLTELRSQLIANKMFEHVTQNVPQSAEQIQVAVIWIKDHQIATDVMQNLKNGESFNTLAQQESLNPNSRVLDLEWLPRNSGLIPAKVEEIAFLLQIGEIGGPIQTAEGFYIITVEDKEADRPLSEQAQQTLNKQIFDDWLEQQRLLTNIEKYITL